MTFARGIFAVFILWSVSFAAWQSIGPDGGPGRAACVSLTNDNLVFTATETAPCRVWRSTNGGASWERRGICTYNGTWLYRMVIDQSDNLYIATGGISKSTDQGLTWTVLPVSAAVYDIAIHPTNPSIIFGAASVSNKMGFIKSTDGGATFSSTIVLDTANTLGQSIAVDFNNPNIIYMGGRTSIYTTRFFKSTDGGVNWVRKNVIDTSGSQIFSAAVHRTNSNIVFAGKFEAGIKGGIYRSTDAGDTWSRVSSGNGCYSLATTAANPNLIFCSAGDTVYRSTDAGVTWTKNNVDNTQGYNNFWSLVISQSNANKVYISAQYNAFYKSTDMGGTWNQATNGLRGCIITAMGIAPSQPRTMYSEFPRNGIWKTTDAGNSWSLYSSFPSECGAMCAFAVNHTDPSIVYTMEGDA